MKLIPTLLCDFYKISHREQYPAGTDKVYSTWTPRTSRMVQVSEVVHFGLQGFLKEWLVDFFDENFFNRNKTEVVNEYVRTIKFALGVPNPDASHLEYLHDLGYLPLTIKSLPEGTKVPLRVPTVTIENNDPKCFWLTNYIETLFSSELWKPTTNATIANEYRKILEANALETVGDTGFVQFQGHDFSMRGMDGVHAATRSGAAHLTSFVGTDTIPSIGYLEEFYGANIEKELVGTSIPATEHSVQCAYGNDLEYFRRMVTEVYPNGFVSIVSDGYDFWDVIGTVIPSLKNDILARTGGPVGDKVVIRPDSGDPVKIVCGDPDGKTELERKGAIEALWDIFGGTVSPQGYKVLNPKIGLIYGDAITLQRCEEICGRLKEKGFATINVVYGIGSYTYQYNTRDTFGYAVKASLTSVNGVEKEIFKDPKTDNGVKKSLKGRVVVVRENGKLVAKDQQPNVNNLNDLLEIVYVNGEILRHQTLAEIRANVRA
jgi:nicotinamide phosphoribosyltransferase